MSVASEVSLPKKGQDPRPYTNADLRLALPQLPLYVGLIVASFCSSRNCATCSHAFDFGEQQIMLAVLGLIDVVLISNLLVMVIVGGYETFVSRLDLQVIPTAGRLAPGKTAYTEAGVMWQTIIHTVFIPSAIGIAVVDRISNASVAEVTKQHAHSLADSAARSQRRAVVLALRMHNSDFDV